MQICYDFVIGITRQKNLVCIWSLQQNMHLYIQAYTFYIVIGMYILLLYVRVHIALKFSDFSYHLSHSSRGNWTLCSGWEAAHRQALHITMYLSI